MSIDSLTFIFYLKRKIMKTEIKDEEKAIFLSEYLKKNNQTNQFALVPNGKPIEISDFVPGKLVNFLMCPNEAGKIRQKITTSFKIIEIKNGSGQVIAGNIILSRVKKLKANIFFPVSENGNQPLISLFLLEKLETNKNEENKEEFKISVSKFPPPLKSMDELSKDFFLESEGGLGWKPRQFGR